LIATGAATVLATRYRIAGRGLGEALDWQIYPPDPRLTSSGVGSHITRRLRAGGYQMYGVGATLLTHGDHESKMNPAERKLNPLVA